MDKNIRNVRKNIIERKKRRVQGQGTTPRQSLYKPPGDEEMHGFPPLITPDSSGRKQPQPSKKSSYLGVQVVLAAALFATVAVGKNASFTWLDGPEQWVTSQMQEDFPFAKVSAWYSDRFGDPLEVISQNEDPAPSQAALPVSGSVTTPFEANGKGIRMAVEAGSPVQAVKSGTVVFVGNVEETGKTVVVQHEDGSKSTYGFLTEVQVHLYENIPAQTVLGDAQASEVFFGIEKNDQYIDPAKVIKVDESS
ncbi:M23 family metallopeptidase [Halobacillus litoralis]|uniref:peptidoglycan DD-metalloendopeptidase family protein n=1 Tax=Halobacillus litoralis TaxID=45668 RepID=UPI001CD6D95F|nr:M23 family metallopeptidase [Halobacillus litoralis]MCA0969940.1 M23 family metallopeptidase [Halobacillus litoralis]